MAGQDTSYNVFIQGNSKSQGDLLRNSPPSLFGETLEVSTSSNVGLLSIAGLKRHLDATVLIADSSRPATQSLDNLETEDNCYDTDARMVFPNSIKSARFMKS